MNEIIYEFEDLDSSGYFELFGNSSGGVPGNNTLHFDNPLAKGALVRSTPDEGLWVRRWKLTVFKNLLLRKLSSPVEKERKLYLMYFLNPTLFVLRNNRKKIRIDSRHNNILLSDNVEMEFSILPKQPFFVLDIALSTSWLLQQFNDADACFRSILNQYIQKDTKIVLSEPCSIEDYKIVRELEVSMPAQEEDILFIRSRVYHLISNFFSKIVSGKGTESVQRIVHYEQIMQAEMIMMENIKRPPKISEIAKRVNLSVSSLLRQFKLIFGKSIYEYHVEKKMEFAKKRLLENRATIKEMTEILGYKQSSHFIETFAKQYGYSPGTLRSSGHKPSFS